MHVKAGNEGWQKASSKKGADSAGRRMYEKRPAKSIIKKGGKRRRTPQCILAELGRNTHMRLDAWCGRTFTRAGRGFRRR